MLIGNIVLLNFLIAVVNQSYEASMQKNKYHSLNARLELINDYYLTLSEENFKDEEMFPKTYTFDKKEIKNTN